MKSYAERLVESVYGPNEIEVGKELDHPTDERVLITGGRYWGTHGLSNFWYWTVLGTGETHHGYGWL